MEDMEVVYNPSHQDADHFWKTQNEKQQVAPQVPKGFPRRLVSPLAWTSVEVQRKHSEWFINLEAVEIEALEVALASFESRSLHLSSITTETFPLPTAFSDRLRGISKNLYSGVGFNVVHGLDPDRYTREQNVIIYAGISAHVASQRGFIDLDSKHVLFHVVNTVDDNAVKTTPVAPAMSNGPVSFHSDKCEILALYALDIAPRGGKTFISSAWRLYNELATKQPDVLKTLAGDWVLDSFHDYDKYPPISAPMLYKVDEEKIIMRFSRYPITGYLSRKRNPNLPHPTKAQIEAIDSVHFRASANAFPLDMGKGDIAFINDMAIMHARESFDEGGIVHKRHLLKLYLRGTSHWKTPPALLDDWKAIYGPNCEDGSRKEIWKFQPGRLRKSEGNNLPLDPISLPGPEPEPDPGPEPRPVVPRTNG